MVAVLNVDTYCFLALSGLTCHLEDTVFFWLFPLPPNVTESELGSSNQEASTSVRKKTQVVLVPCRTWKCVPTANSGDADLLEVPGSHFLRQMSFQ